MPLKKKKKKKPALKKKKASLKKRPSVKKKAVKRKPAKKAARKKTSPRKKAKAGKKALSKKMRENILGTVTHYFPHVRAAVIKLDAPLAVGDVVKIKGHTTDFTQKIASMQIDRVPISEAKKGDEIGLLVDSRVRKKDLVFKG